MSLFDRLLKVLSAEESITADGNKGDCTAVWFKSSLSKFTGVERAVTLSFVSITLLRLVNFVVCGHFETRPVKFTAGHAVTAVLICIPSRLTGIIEFSRTD